MLSHRNVLANIDGANALFRLGADDVVLGVLPFFHSFGYTVTLWLPLVVGFARRLSSQPDRRQDDRRDGGEVRRHAADQHADVLLGLRAQDASPSSSRTLRLAIVGAERLREPIAAAFKDKFGVELHRGLRLHRDGAGGRGQRARRRRQRLARRHVGRPLPGISAKIVDPDTGEGPLVGKEGLLLVTGPNQMRGYLGDAGSHARRRSATAGMSPATSPRSTRTASSASPTGCRASARSPARWCRT